MTEEKQFWFILIHITGLGIRKVWDIYLKLRELNLSPSEFQQLSGEDYKHLFRFNTNEIKLLKTAFRKKEETLQISKKIDSLGVKTTFIEDEDYPEDLKKFVRIPPLFIYTIGSYDILSQHLFGIINSKNLSSEGLEIAFRIVRKVPDNNVALLYGNSLEPFEVIAYVSKVRKIPSVVVLNRGMLEIFDNGTVKEFRTFCKNVSTSIDFDNTLILSFVNPGFGWSIPIEQKRNEILTALSDTLMIIEARKNGLVFKNSLKALKNNKNVFVYLPCTKLPASSTGNIELAEKGCLPIAFDNDFKNTSILFSSKPECKQEEMIVPPVIEFFADIFKLLVHKENNQVVDPACGNGYFLQSAVKNGFSNTNGTFGFECHSEHISEWFKKNLLQQFRLANVSGLINSIKMGIEPGKFDVVFSSLANRRSEFNDEDAINPEIIHTLISEYELWKMRDNNDYDTVKTDIRTHENLFENLNEKTTTKERLNYIYKQISSVTEREKADIPEEIIKALASLDPEIFYFERLIQLMKNDGAGASVISKKMFYFISTSNVTEWLNGKVFPFSLVDLIDKETVLFIFLGLNHPVVRQKPYPLKVSFYEIKSDEDYEKVFDLIKNKMISV